MCLSIHNIYIKQSARIRYPVSGIPSKQKQKQPQNQTQSSPPKPQPKIQNHPTNPYQQPTTKIPLHSPIPLPTPKIPPLSYPSQKSYYSPNPLPLPNPSTHPKNPTIPNIAKLVGKISKIAIGMGSETSHIATH